MKKIRVLNSYDVLVGCGVINNLSELIRVKKYSKVFIITGPAIHKHHIAKVKKIINSTLEEIIIKVYESQKTIESVQEIWERLYSLGCDRKSLIIILGGGVLGDLAGFSAATFMRGIPFIQIPTTLLAQVDSSVGGKNGINFKGVKNLIGTFDQPLAVICDIDFLSTLPKREFIGGFGEIIKHGLVADKNYFDFVTSKKPRNFNKEELAKIIQGSVKIKAQIVNNDEKEKGSRKLINFGHTIGHGVEALSQKTNKPLSHGEAVSIGMVVEAKISQILGFISQKEVNRIIKSLNNAGLPTSLPTFSVKELIKKIKSDKKIEAGEVKWTLIKRIGEGIINQEFSEQILKKVLQEAL